MAKSSSITLPKTLYDHGMAIAQIYENIDESGELTEAQESAMAELDLSEAAKAGNIHGLIARATAEAEMHEEWRKWHERKARARLQFVAWMKDWILKYLKTFGKNELATDRGVKFYGHTNSSKPVMIDGQKVSSDDFEYLETNLDNGSAVFIVKDGPAITIPSEFVAVSYSVDFAAIRTAIGDETAPANFKFGEPGKHLRTK